MVFRELSYFIHGACRFVACSGLLNQIGYCLHPCPWPCTFSKLRIPSPTLYGKWKGACAVGYLYGIVCRACNGMVMLVPVCHFHNHFLPDFHLRLVVLLSTGRLCEEANAVGGSRGVYVVSPDTRIISTK